jgi:tryptophan-rich sensory protein
LVAALTVVLLVIAARASLPMLIALLPYQIWVIIASFLSWSYARLN